MEAKNPNKPLGGKNYGSIAHLPGSRMGPGDHSCHEGQERICNEKARQVFDRIAREAASHDISKAELWHAVGRHA